MPLRANLDRALCVSVCVYGEEEGLGDGGIKEQEDRERRGGGQETRDKRGIIIHDDDRARAARGGSLERNLIRVCPLTLIYSTHHTKATKLIYPFSFYPLTCGSDILFEILSDTSTQKFQIQAYI